MILTDEMRDAIDVQDRAAVLRVAEQIIDESGVPREEALLGAFLARNMIRRWMMGLPPLEWPPLP